MSQFEGIKQQVLAEHKRRARKRAAESLQKQTAAKVASIDSRLERLEVTMTSLLDTVTQLMLEK